MSVVTHGTIPFWPSCDIPVSPYDPYCAKPFGCPLRPFVAPSFFLSGTKGGRGGGYPWIHLAVAEDQSRVCL